MPRRGRLAVDSSALSFRYRTQADAEYATAQIHDLSGGGVSITPTDALKTDATLEFELQLGDDTMIHGSAKVAWVAKEGKRGGLAFVELKDHAARMLELWLSAV